MIHVERQKASNETSNKSDVNPELARDAARNEKAKFDSLACNTDRMRGRACRDETNASNLAKIRP